MFSAISREGRITIYEPKGKELIMIHGEVGSLKKEYVVRLIRDEGYRKSCIAEEVFEEEPTENQILWCLIKHKDASFAVKGERYRTDRFYSDINELPFE